LRADNAGPQEWLQRFEEGELMQIRGSTALVTGASRGLGRALVEALRTAGCRKIYAAARSVGAIVAGATIEPVRLDITNGAEVAAAAARCADVDLLINNAGVAAFVPALAASTLNGARAEMETNYFGTLAMCRAFAPVLAGNGGGALVNILSVTSWFSVPMQGSYCASKAAAWSLTRAARFELRAQGTLVVGVYAGYIDTDMTAALTIAKSRPEEIAQRILAGIEAGIEDILADERAKSVHAELLKDSSAFDAGMQKLWDQRPPAGG
jgi:NAD(P)-dependent dehydrogenase (short-subunit alcohol dehydrogenase family)